MQKVRKMAEKQGQAQQMLREGRKGCGARSGDVNRVWKSGVERREKMQRGIGPDARTRRCHGVRDIGNRRWPLAMIG